MGNAKPKKQDDERRRSLAKIHIARKQLGMDRDSYQQMLRDVAGVKSAAALDYAGRVMVLEHLRRCGFKPSHSSAKASGMHVRTASDREPYLSKIEAILAVLGLPWSYVDAMAKKMFQVDRVRWLDPDQLHKLLVALIYHQRRKGAVHYGK